MFSRRGILLFGRFLRHLLSLCNFLLLFSFLTFSAFLWTFFISVRNLVQNYIAIHFPHETLRQGSWRCFLLFATFLAIGVRTFFIGNDFHIDFFLFGFFDIAFINFYFVSLGIAIMNFSRH